MEIKCETCGYKTKNEIICPRCRKPLVSLICNGNCLSCNTSKKKDKANAYNYKILLVMAKYVNCSSRSNRGFIYY